LLPDLVGAIDLHVGLPDALDMRDQNIVTPASGTAQGGIAPLPRIPLMLANPVQQRLRRASYLGGYGFYGRPLVSSATEI